MRGDGGEDRLRIRILLSGKMDVKGARIFVLLVAVASVSKYA